jgi:outer membrane protein OmpA-like peptidoglycan-associated protein
MKTSIAATLALSSFALVGCATTRPPAELVEARAAYADAETEAKDAAPKDLHEAKIALDAAERAFEDDPGSVEVKDRAYLALRFAELARTRAATHVLHRERDAANQELRALGSAAATELRTTKADLTDAKAKMRVAAGDVSGLRAELDDSRAELDDSESRESELKTNIAVERQARIDAEKRLTESLMAMRDLQSVKEEVRGLVITLSGAVLFSSGQAMLLPAARDALNNVAEALKATPGRKITVLGHTDAEGSSQSNMVLSQRRADAVRLYLVSRGVEAANIEAMGVGSEQPITENTTANGRANNRRVEIVLANEAPEEPTAAGKELETR